MSQTPPADLGARLEALGRELGAREAAHRAALGRARAEAERLQQCVREALERYHRVVSEAGAPQLAASVSDVRTDDKHLRALQFDVARGRYRAIITVKARGEVTLVGPFHAGKAEGPCRTFPIDGTAEIDAALVGFLERFLEEAATP